MESKPTYLYNLMESNTMSSIKSKRIKPTVIYLIYPIDLIYLVYKIYPTYLIYLLCLIYVTY